jgi:hypothetical protein
MKYFCFLIGLSAFICAQIFPNESKQLLNAAFIFISAHMIMVNNDENSKKIIDSNKNKI